MRGLIALVLAAMTMQAPSAITIDHLILGIADLEKGVAEFQRATGVKPVFGGVHPGRGTQNALASLGDGKYIEVIAIDPNQQVTAPMVEELRPLTSLTPVGWALHATDLAASQQQLAAQGITAGGIRPGSRAKPDGSRLEWSTMNITDPPHTWMPFLIRWSDPSKQPAATSPGGCSLMSLEIEDPNPEPLRKLTAAARLQVGVKEAATSRMLMTLRCPSGTVRF